MNRNSMRPERRLSGHQQTLRSVYLLLLLWASLYISGCASTQDITYFRDLPPDARQGEIMQASYRKPVIHEGDRLLVSVQSQDPEAEALLKPQFYEAGSVPATAQQQDALANIGGQRVSKEGDITLPLFGKIHVKDRTIDEVQEDIRGKAAEYYKDPIVNVGFASFKVTVLGEVSRPATYNMGNDKVTVLDALGMAGDLTIYGKRDNVLLIRDANDPNKKKYMRLDLNSSRLFTSPGYYLQQGDMVYVEPNKSKVVSTDAMRVRNVTIISSILTVLVVLASRVNL